MYYIFYKITRKISLCMTYENVFLNTKTWEMWKKYHKIYHDLEKKKQNSWMRYTIFLRIISTRSLTPSSGSSSVGCWKRNL